MIYFSFILNSDFPTDYGKKIFWEILGELQLRCKTLNYQSMNKNKEYMSSKVLSGTQTI